MNLRHTWLAAALAAPALVLGSASAMAQGSATVGSGGSASAGDTAASTLGTAGASTDADGNSSRSLAVGGSAASADGKAKSDTKIIENRNMLKGQSKAMAHDGGTFSRSKTKTRVKNGQLSSDTRTMSHVPGQKPVKSTSSSASELPE